MLVYFLIDIKLRLVASGIVVKCVLLVHLNDEGDVFLREHTARAGTAGQQQARLFP